MKCGAFSVHTMKHCYATALYTTRAQAASGGEETAWAPLLTHAHHTHKNVHVKVSKRIRMFIWGWCACVNSGAQAASFQPEAAWERG